jgi:hypothetical protein
MKDKLITKIETNFDKRINNLNKIGFIHHNKFNKYVTGISSTIYNVLEFYSKKNNDELVFSTKFNYYGMIINNVFTWATSFEGIDKQFMLHINKIRSCAYLFENSNDPNILFYYQILTNDKFSLSETKILKFIKLLMYLDNSFYYIQSNLDGKLVIATLICTKSSPYYEKNFL